MGRVNLRWRALDFRNLMVGFREFRRLDRRLFLRTLIAANDTIFLTPFPRRPQIGREAVWIGIFLASIMVWSDGLVNWRGAVRNFCKILEIRGQSIAPPGDSLPTP